MNISISKIDANQSYEVLFSSKIKEISGAFELHDVDSIFYFDEKEYSISGQVLASSKKGSFIVKRTSVAILRLLVVVDPTFLLTARIDDKNWIELNISI